MSIASELLTVDQLDQFPNDGKRREIIEGELHVSPAPVRDHQFLVKRVLGLLVREIDDKGHGEAFPGPVDVRFSPGDQMQPDVIALSNGRPDAYQDHVMHGAPDIVVEILSPSNESYDRVEKRRLYEVNGVAEYWIIDPTSRDMTILRLTNGVYAETASENGLLRSTAIVDLTIDPAALFARPGGA
ncbi:MAG: Uma2 family endonuclease [Thermomicrobiales bacterium]|nr:Uma2 family endonuclease [Thermomicrobiales bacterium]